MGIFSLFSKQKIVEVHNDNQEKKDLSLELDKEFFTEVADSSDIMLLYFLQGEG
jgi:DNA polymerase III delta subunit